MRPVAPTLFTFLALLAPPQLPAQSAGSQAAPEPAETLPDLRDCRLRAGPGFPGFDARCGFLLRPLDPSDPNSPTIDLHVAVVPALSLEPRADAFVPIAGGPGQASSEFYASQAAAFEKIRRDRDIVLVDQRGTGRSARLTCDVDEDIVLGEIDEATTLAATRECLETLPHDPRFFTTSVAVADLEAVRAALGYEALNVYGVSYGSRVAQHYARRHPATTRSVVLDGVVPPTLALGPDIPLEAQRALDRIFARCAEDADCGERFPDLPGDFARLRERLADGAVDVVIPNPYSGETSTVRFGELELGGAIRLLAYSPSTIALVPLLVHEGANGNLAPLAAQHALTTRRVAESLAIGMHNAVVCTEDVPFIDFDALPRDALESTYLGPLMPDALRTICSVWPAGVLDEGFREPLGGDTPVLLLSGDADPITPPAYAEQAMVDLDNAMHLIGRNQGHGLAPAGCVPDILGRFISSASLDGLDAGCVERLHAMPFFLSFAGPAP